MSERESSAIAYAQQLLASLRVRHDGPIEAPAEHPAVAWARSGLMWLTGLADGPPQLCAAPLACCADGALAALRAVSGGAGRASFAGLRGATLLGERAAIARLGRRGAVSPGGNCRLLEAADGWIAASLVREEDWLLVPAWLEESVAEWSWETLPGAVRHRTQEVLIARGRLLGLAVAPLRAPSRTGPHWVRIDHGRPWTAHCAVPQAPLVVDLGALWAGPLCAHLLQLCGARVIKVESLQRPDGARRGSPAFFELMNAGKESIALDFDSVAGRTSLQQLCRAADIVIEASRPRALRQLGIQAEAMIAENPRLTWVSITGYGRAEPQDGWIAYGDDAGVAAGLSAILRETSGVPLICADAIADPLTGLHAALAAWQSHRTGGGRLVSLALREVVAHCIDFDTPRDAQALHRRHDEWLDLLAARGIEPDLPRARPAGSRAPGNAART